MGGTGARYPNGFIPNDVLVTFDSGWIAGEGNWTHRLSVGSYVKHRNLVLLAEKNRGRKLEISRGDNAYRDYAAQVYARKVHGNGAAYPGTSSHGGWWENKNCLAMDYGNWSYVYDGNREAFYADVRAVGLTPGMISKERGYPDEPWHVIDLDPWRGVPAGWQTPPETEKKEFEMAEAIVSTPNGVVVHLRSGGKTNFSSPSDYNTFRDQVAFLREAGATDLMALPELSKVPGVTWPTFEFLCGYMGAPVK